jgi:hypothetical protein
MGTALDGRDASNVVGMGGLFPVSASNAITQQKMILV